MTVRKLLYWSATEGAASTQAYDGLVNMLLALQASQPARWSVQCSAYRPLQATDPDGQPRAPTGTLAKDLYSVSFSEQPQSLFLVARTQQLVLEGNSELQALLEKLRLYQLRATLQLEGQRYRLGDFSVGIARAVQKPLEEFRGIILEVAYHPLSSQAAAEPALQEFCGVLQEEAAAGVGAPLRLAAASLEGFRLLPAFSQQHAAVQHVQLMAQLLGHP